MSDAEAMPDGGPATLKADRLTELLSKFPQRRIALLGDLFLDRYLELNRDVELSIETGLEAYQIERVRNAPGALGTVMNNLSAIGVGELSPITVIGDDGHGYDLRRCLESLPVNDSWIVADPRRLTPTYTKPLRPTDDGWVELNRLDVKTRSPLTESATIQLIRGLREAWSECDGLIVLDQIAEANCGVVNETVRDELHQLAAADPGKLMIIDSRAMLQEFHVGVLKGNESEFRSAAQAGSNASLRDAVCGMLLDAQNRDVRGAYCTDGPRGIWFAERMGDSVELVQAPGRQVSGPIDIVGAGDSVTSALAAAWLSGASPVEAAQVANLAASICVQKLGETGVATPTELLAALGARQHLSGGNST